MKIGTKNVETIELLKYLRNVSRLLKMFVAFSFQGLYKYGIHMRDFTGNVQILLI